MKSYFPGFTFESKWGGRYKGNVIKLIISYFDENFKENEIQLSGGVNGQSRVLPTLERVVWKCGSQEETFEKIYG